MSKIYAKTLADVDENDYSIDLPAEETRIIAPAKPQMIAAAIALAVTDGENYRVHTPFGDTMLQRDIDFGVIPGTKQPSLLKAGAEKLACAYGLLQHYSIETKFEMPDPERPVFFYMVKCELVKIGPNGKEYIFTTGYGSANTNEKRNGRNSAWDAANSCVKMAQKRALVAAALSISGLSSMFTQDMESESFVNDNLAALSATNRAESPITRKQMNLIYAKAGNLGLTAPQAKARMAEAGYASVKALTQADFKEVIKLFETPAEKEAREKGEIEA